MLESKAQNLPWGLWSPIVAIYLSLLKNQKLHFWLKWHTLYPLNAFSFCNWEENVGGKRVLLDGMEDVYLCGYRFSGSATHISSMLMGIKM